MKVKVGTLAITVSLLFASRTVANPLWEAGYPKAGDKAGTILVKGTFVVPAGMKTTGTVKVMTWPVGGGEQKTATFQVPANKAGRATWGELKVSSLDSGTTYNVWVEIVIKDMAGKTSAYSPAVKPEVAR